MNNKKITYIEKVIDYIETRLDSHPDLDTVAAAVHYSKYHLHRMFTETVGMTIHDYTLRRRLTESAKLLVFSDRPILDIALICGYESRQAFTLAFKEMYKVPPGEYRKRGEFYPLLLRFSLCPGNTGGSFSAGDIRLAHPAAPVLTHPECLPAVRELSAFVGSTAEIVARAAAGAEGEYIVCTEPGVLFELRRRCPHKRFYPVTPPCADMKRVTPARVLACLRDGSGEVSLPAAQARAALRPLERMLELAK